MNSPSAYMTRETARSLLALSRSHTDALRLAREQRKLKAELVAIGWSDTAAQEMIDLHYAKERK